MKIQEAIENLKYLISGDCTDNQMGFVEEIEMAINALEKQIPKNPIINKRKIQCVNGHNQPTQHYKYCPMCGQLMAWNAHPTEKGGDEQ